MEIFLANFAWMIPNLALACMGFLFGLLYLRSKSTLFRIPLFILWILFLPNTIYLLTDWEHYFAQLTVADFIGVVLLTAQYLFLTGMGILTYFAGMIPLEKLFRRAKIKHYSFAFLVVNFVIAFAVVLGKVERTHSWYVFTQPWRVVQDVLHLLTTPPLVFTVIFFGILFNLIYFAFRKRFSKLK